MRLLWRHVADRGVVITNRTQLLFLGVGDRKSQRAAEMEETGRNGFAFLVFGRDGFDQPAEPPASARYSAIFGAGTARFVVL
jgi:hypothetical protein